VGTDSAPYLCSLQTSAVETVNLSTATVSLGLLLKEAVDFVSQLKSKFNDVCQTAESTAAKWGAATTFKDTRIWTKKLLF